MGPQSGSQGTLWTGGESHLKEKKFWGRVGELRICLRGTSQHIDRVRRICKEKGLRGDRDSEKRLRKVHRSLPKWSLTNTGDRAREISIFGGKNSLADPSLERGPDKKE